MPRGLDIPADERGQRTIEYALGAGLVALVTVTGVNLADVMLNARAGLPAATFDQAREVIATRAGDDDIITGSIGWRDD